MTAPKATLIGWRFCRFGQQREFDGVLTFALITLRSDLVRSSRVSKVRHQSTFQNRAPKFVVHLSGGWDRRSTASGEREASDHAHHIWIVPAQRMEPLSSAVLRAYQQYRRLVRAVASSRRHPDFKEKRFCAHGLPKAHARIKRNIHPTGNSQTFL